MREVSSTDTETLRYAVNVAAKEAIVRALTAEGGDRVSSSKRLGISLRNLQYKMLHLGIKFPRKMKRTSTP